MSREREFAGSCSERAYVAMSPPLAPFYKRTVSGFWLLEIVRTRL